MNSILGGEFFCGWWGELRQAPNRLHSSDILGCSFFVLKMIVMSSFKSMINCMYNYCIANILNGMNWHKLTHGRLMRNAHVRTNSVMRRTDCHTETTYFQTHLAFLRGTFLMLILSIERGVNGPKAQIRRFEQIIVFCWLILFINERIPNCVETRPK